MTAHTTESEIALPPPVVSIVVLAWDQLELTKACVASIRATTDRLYELIIVDNGSAPEARSFAKQAADHAVLNDTNLGFAAGNNAGLAEVSAPTVMFLNNDTVLPEGWTRLLDTLEAHPSAGIVVPVLTASGTAITVRDKPGDAIEAVQPFGPVPSGVCYLMRTAEFHEIGGWNEIYPIASGEDLDLAFTYWVNDRDIVIDERVLVDHVGHGTSDTKLPDRESLWRDNRALFLERWQDPSVACGQLADCPPDRFARNRQIAAAVARWQELYLRNRNRLKRMVDERDAAQDRLATVERELELLRARKIVRWGLWITATISRLRPRRPVKSR